MVQVLKLMFFLVILQLALASTVYSKKADDTTDGGNGASRIAIDRRFVWPPSATTANRQQLSTEDQMEMSQDFLDENVNNENTPRAVPAEETGNSGILNENSPWAVPGEVTPDEFCGGATFDRIHRDWIGGTTHDNLIALVPEEVWNSNLVKSPNCQTRMSVYCLPSGLGDCKNPDFVYSVTVNIVGSTGPNGDPKEFILHLSPFSAIAVEGASRIAIDRRFLWPHSATRPHSATSPPSTEDDQMEMSQDLQEIKDENVTDV